MKYCQVAGANHIKAMSSCTKNSSDDLRSRVVRQLTRTEMSPKKGKSTSNARRKTYVKYPRLCDVAPTSHDFSTSELRVSRH